MIAPFNFLIPVSGALLSAIFLGENILELKYALRWRWCAPASGG
jgi:drug/metabolite transporter (DMT)-like permease